MAKNRLDIGDIVAESMQQIIQSDEHKKTFFNKKASSKCCSCDSCDKNCSCSHKCAKECTACVKEKTSAINEVIDLLSKISTVQDELGLTKSSVTTMQALATMIAELKKNAGEDINDVSYEELIAGLKNNSDERNAGKLDAWEYPDILDHLRRRIEESETGEFSLPVNLFEDGVSADAASDIPNSLEFDDPDFVVEPPDSGDLPTWGPDGEDGLTQLPPASLRSEQIPLSPRIPDIDRTLGDRELESLDDKETATIPVPKGAFEKLNNLLTKQAQDDVDFEDEADDDTSLADDELFEDEEGLELLEEDSGYGFTYDLGDDTELIRIPDGDKGEWKRYRDLNGPERSDLSGAMLFGDPLDIDPDELTTEEVYADENWDLGNDAEDWMIEDIKDKQRDEWDEDGPMDKFFWDE